MCKAAPLQAPRIRSDAQWTLSPLNLHTILPLKSLPLSGIVRRPPGPHPKSASVANHRNLLPFRIGVKAARPQKEGRAIFASPGPAFPKICGAYQYR